MGPGHKRGGMKWAQQCACTGLCNNKIINMIRKTFGTLMVVYVKGGRYWAQKLCDGNGHVRALCGAKACGEVSMSGSSLSLLHIWRIRENGGS